MRAAIIRVVVVTGELALFGGRAIVEAVRPPFEWRETLRHIYDLGVRSVPLIAARGYAVGIVLSMHTRASLAGFGAEALIPAGLGLAYGGPGYRAARHRGRD